MTKLRISPDLTLPIETVTESIAILAKRGAGKTYTASALVEEMLKAKLQVVVLDPMGAWWGLRSSADGRGPGFEIAILGGKRGDVPLEPTAGKVVADLVVDERIPAILDLSPFSKNDRRKFVAEFLEQLYRRNDDAMHVVLEEADLFAPEGKLKRAGDEAMLGAVYDLVRRGRGRGIGSTLITQRSASLSKEVLTQAEILIALRTTGPHDQAAIKEWIRYHGTDEERELVMSELASLPTGEAYVWWPVEEILRRVKIRAKETFDSSATPKPGQTRREPKKLADVDLAGLQEQMAATIEKAKAADPKELQRQIRELEAKASRLEGQTKLLERAQQREPEREIVPEIVQVDVVPDEKVKALQEATGNLTRFTDALQEYFTEQLEPIRVALVDVAGELKRVNGSSPAAGAGRTERAGPAAQAQAKPAAVSPAPARRPAPATAPTADGDFAPSGPQQRILDALAALEAIGILEAHKTQLALFAEASPKSSSYTNNLGSLRTAGLIDYPAGGRVVLTDAGRAIADGGRAPTSTAELHEFVYGLVGGAKARLLYALIDCYPSPLTKAELAERAGASATSSSFTNNLGSLRSLGLIDYPAGGQVVALPVLFLGEAT